MIEGSEEASGMSCKLINAECFLWLSEDETGELPQKRD